MPSRRMVLVKLGGSLITDKRRSGTVREQVLLRLAQEISRGSRRRSSGLILGHGSGSFGHVVASRFDLARGVHSPAQLRGVSETQSQARRLHARVIEALLGSDTRPYTLAPSSWMTTALGRPRTATLEPFLEALKLGLLPVTFGDVVMDHDMGASIASTETVLHFLAVKLKSRGFAVERVLWLGETEGVLDRQGRCIPEVDADNIREVMALAGASAGIDVTGGMQHRLETVWALARGGIESWILNGLEPGLLERALGGGEVPCTRVPGAMSATP